MKKILLVLFPILFLAGCASSTEAQLDPSNEKSKAELTLENLGYTDIQMTGVAWWGCDEKSDSWFTSKKFTAQNNGKHIEGSVCCGLFLKGCTVRF